MADALEKPDPENFHRWRKEVKDLWYQLRLLAPLNRIVLEKLGVALKAWKSAQVHEASVDRALARMDAVCQKLPAGAPERAVCRDVLRRSGPSG